MIERVEGPYLSSMKKFIVILAILFSCKKESVNKPLATDQPQVVSYTFASVRDGGEQRPRFDVNIKSDTDSVLKLELYRVPSTLVWYVDKPITGKYIMYDHLSNYPTGAENVFYFFVFVMKDGTTVQGKPFQVY